MLEGLLSLSAVTDLFPDSKLSYMRWLRMALGAIDDFICAGWVKCLFSCYDILMFKSAILSFRIKFSLCNSLFSDLMVCMTAFS